MSRKSGKNPMQTAEHGGQDGAQTRSAKEAAMRMFSGALGKGGMPKTSSQLMDAPDMDSPAEALEQAWPEDEMHKQTVLQWSQK